MKTTENKPRIEPADVSASGDDTSDGRLTTEELRSFPGCSSYTEEQAAEVTATLRSLSEYLYDLQSINPKAGKAAMPTRTIKITNQQKMNKAA